MAGSARARRHARSAASLAAALMAAGCAGEEPVAGERVGIYALSETPEGLEVRSVPDQRPWVGRLLGRFDSVFGRAGAPVVRLSPQRIVERRFWGAERQWSPGEVSRVVVRRQRRELWQDKLRLLARPWRVLLVRRDGTSLRRSFRLEKEAQARELAARVEAALGPPEGRRPPGVEPSQRPRGSRFRRKTDGLRRGRA